MMCDWENAGRLWLTNVFEKPDINHIEECFKVRYLNLFLEDPVAVGAPEELVDEDGEPLDMVALVDWMIGSDDYSDSMNEWVDAVYSMMEG